MAVELWLVRHGQAAFASENYDQLTDLGWQQARWLGAHLAEMEISFDRIAAGTLRRQQETARSIAEALGGAVETVPGLEEYSAASLLEKAGFRDRDPGMSRRAHFKRLRGLLMDWAEGRAHSNETWDAFRDRVMGAVGELTRKGEGKVIAAASGGSIAMALSTLLELPPAQMIEFNLQGRNTGISRLVFAGDHVYFNMFNAIPHLERPERKHAETYS